MALRQVDIGGVFQQRKKASKHQKDAGPLKGRDNIFSTYQEEGGATASVGSGTSQPAALVTSRGGRKDVTDSHDDVEEALRQFDMNSAYGPCLGMTRMERWERARCLGLSPPENIRHLLESAGGSADCLWEGRV